MFPQRCLRNVFTLSFHLRILEMSSCDIKKLNQNLCPYLVWGVGGGGRLSLSLRVQSQAKVPIDGVDVNCRINSHRVYQELVYRNEVLKTMLARSNYPSLPNSPAVFAQLLSMRFPDLSWNGLRQKEKSALFIPLPPPILTRRCCVGVKATFRKQQTTQLWMRGVRKSSRLFCFP